MADGGENKILLEPQVAGQYLQETRSSMMQYLQQIMQIAEVLRATAAATFSSPLAAALMALAQVLTEAGHAVNEGVSSYSNAFKDTVEKWKQTDATAANAVSFDKPAFDGVQINTADPTKLDVTPSRIQQLLEQHQEHHQQMNNHFGSMTESLMNSKSWAIGSGFDITRQTWQNKVVPLNEKASQYMSKAGQQIGDEHKALIARSRNTYVS